MSQHSLQLASSLKAFLASWYLDITPEHHSFSSYVAFVLRIANLEDGQKNGGKR